MEPALACVPSSREPLAWRPDTSAPGWLNRPCEILQELGFHNINQTVTPSLTLAQKPGSGSSPLDNKYEMLLDAAGFEPVDIDVLAFRTGWSGHDGAAMLLLLELQGRIAPRPGGRYCRLS
jgi:predicted Rossmann fold nucleotide-binding protein DprA/Smf involved in DNA uptake